MIGTTGIRVCMVACQLACVGAAAASETILFSDSPAYACYRAVVNWGNDLGACDLAIERQALSPPERAATYSNRGILRLRNGDLKDALADHNRAIKLAPTLSSIYINRAKALTHAKRYDEAFDDLARAIEIGEPNLGVAHYNRALLFHTLGDTASARQEAETAVQLAPESEAYRAFLEGLDPLGDESEPISELDPGELQQPTRD